jgi:hypothetical protein
LIVRREQEEERKRKKLKTVILESDSDNDEEDELVLSLQEFEENLEKYLERRRIFLYCTNKQMYIVKEIIFISVME